MKVILYTRVFAPSVGGVESLVATLASRLSAAGQATVDLTVVTETPSGGMDDRGFPFPVVRQPGTRRLIGLLRDAELIHLAGPSLLPMVLAWLMRKPVILAHHGFQTVCPNGQLFYEPLRMPCPGFFTAQRYEKCWECNRSRGLGRLIWMWLSTFVRRWLAARAAVNVVPTRALGEILALPRTYVVAHGVPQGTEGPAAATHNTISYLGRLVSSKGVHILLQAAAHLRQRGVPFHLQIIGDGPERSALEQQARTARLNGCVVFRGLLPDADLAAALAGSIIVVPSLGGEVFGLVAVQNLMAGRAVVASELATLAEVVGDAGQTFPPGDAVALADRLQHLLGNPSEIARLGAQARQRAKELFTVEQMTRSHVQLYLSNGPAR